MSAYSPVSVSVIIPAYNQGNTISKTLASVLPQIKAGIEVIVVDDGSTDNTKVVIQEFDSQKVIRYYYTMNRGVCAARNFGAIVSEGRYLVFLDGDDELMPNYFNSAELIILQQEPDFIFVGASFYVDSILQKDVFPTHPYGKLSEEGLFLAGTFFVRKEVFQSLGGYDDHIRYGENTEFSIRVNSGRFSKVFINECLLRVNQVSNRRSSTPSNLIKSINYTLIKHHAYFTKHPLAFLGYKQILAVSYLRNGDLEAGRMELWRAWLLRPNKLITLIRLILTYLPWLRRKIYGV